MVARVPYTYSFAIEGTDVVVMQGQQQFTGTIVNGTVGPFLVYPTLPITVWRTKRGRIFRNPIEVTL